MKNKLVNLSPKQLHYIDQKTGNYIQASCELSALGTEVREFFCSIERMKLDSSIIGESVLKEGKTTVDLIQKYKELLSSDIIDFSDIVDLYEPNKRKTNVALIPALNFLNLFDINIEKEYTSLEVYTSLTKTRNPLFSTSTYEKKKKALKSITPNTEILHTPIINLLAVNPANISNKKQRQSQGDTKIKTKTKVNLAVG